MRFLQEDSMNEQEIKEQLCDVCHKMWQLGWVAANDGNVSVKLEDGTFFATPTGMSKSFITPDKLLRIDAKGNVLEGAEGLRPSSEIKMHLRCYEKRADVNAVVHAHPPAATGFAVAHRPMDMYNMIEDVAAIAADSVWNPQHDGGAGRNRAVSQRPRCYAAGKPRCADSGQRCHHRLLPHGESGTVGKNHDQRNHSRRQLRY